MTRSVVLLSGGLDSATALGIARARGDECYTLALDYGQRHRAELAAARSVSAALGAREHRELRVSLGDLGGSALTDTSIDVPEQRRRRHPDHLRTRAQHRVPEPRSRVGGSARCEQDRDRRNGNRL